MTKKADYRLYLVTDRELSLGRPIEDVVFEAVRGGVTMVQLREKTLPTRPFVEFARRLKVMLTPLDIPLIINDRIDIALSSGADGVHIGQEDMSCLDARRLLGPEAIIGLSVENLEQAAEAEALDVDYLGVSPIFVTPTKSELETQWGLEGLQRLRHKSRKTLVAIGGIGSEDAAGVLNAGADGLAVVSAICSAADPRAAAADLRRIIESN